MILSFATQINKKPTYFVEKIHKALRLPCFKDSVGFSSTHVPKDFDFIMYPLLEPKLHTIREDKNNRWKAGVKIDFFINCRQKNMFRFAPVLPVVSVQRIFMTYHSGDVIEMTIGDRYIFSYSERLEIAQNDGFDNWQDFFDYFYPIIEKSEDKSFSGKIIHWTEKRY